ncbi:MAG: 4-hydroxy-tetrahydrodipicolinate reductase [Candidatus Diapherotrites archaeon]|nr:4-hydroxy-tetrahydrodipicolinate reductase [Candidatus Diapherotrites archaeon]
MNIAIIGYGKMGQAIAGIAQKEHISIAAIIDPQAPEATHKEITADSVKNADVCIEFTQPDQCIQNIQKLASLKKNIVVGTTGWNDKISEVEQIVKKHGIGLVYASNFSLGVHVFLKLVQHAATIMNRFPEYDVYGLDLHHSQKKDSPSGTARLLSDILLNEIDRKKSVQFEKLERKLLPEEIHFASVRAGNIPGTHTIAFDSSADKIELTHEAKNREGFAHGSLKAAEFIQNKKGMYSIEALLEELMK